MNNIYLLIFLFVFSALTIALSGDFLIKLLQKIGFVQFIREEGPASHKAKSNTPTAGGLAFISLLLIVPATLAFWSFLNKSEISWPKIWCIALVLLASAAIGFWDDYLKKVKKQNEGLKPTQKLICQIILSLLLAWFVGRSSTNIFGYSLELPWLLFAFFVFLVLAGSLNAANLTDGLDGLAASVIGCSYFSLGVVLLVKATPSIESAAWAFALAGLCFGFLRINGHPAKVFMGDTGSFFLGGGLACLALLENLEWYLLIFMLVPIFETLSVMMQVASAKFSRKFLGKDWRPFRMTPFHHHLELSGWSEKKIVRWLALFQAASGLVLLIIYLIK